MPDPLIEVVAVGLRARLLEVGPPNRDDLLGALAAAEVFAAFTHRLPLITEMCRNHPTRRTVLLRALAVSAVVFAHLIRTIPPTLKETQP